MQKNQINLNRIDKKLNLEQFAEKNPPFKIGDLKLNPPNNQNILRMLIRSFPGNLLIPDEFKWVMPMISMAESYQKTICAHPFLYLTIRTSNMEFNKIDEWHVDGFSTQINHLPEQNYIWCSDSPTEYIVQGFNINSNFDPLKHNLHKYIGNRINSNIMTIGKNEVWMIDPYVVHRSPKVVTKNRIFIRISFTPIEIKDINNTNNPLLPREHTYDGVVDFRDKLTDYDLTNKN